MSYNQKYSQKKIGTRFDIDSPILPDDQLNILWGLDYFHEDSSQPADIFDSQVFARSDGLVFQKNWFWLFIPSYRTR